MTDDIASASDIVTRLHDTATRCSIYSVDRTNVLLAATHIREQQAEIERLRAELEQVAHERALTESAEARRDCTCGVDQRGYHTTTCDHHWSRYL